LRVRTLDAETCAFIQSRPATRMRKSLGQLLIIGLFAVFRAHGQDAASTPFRDSPAPAESAAPAPTARPTPAPNVEQQPAAPESAPSATPMPVQRAQPVTRGPALAPVRAVPPRPADAKPAPKAQAARPEEAQRDEPNGGGGDRIKALEREWETAISNHDGSVIERVVADDFVGVSSTGRIGDKGTLLGEVRRDKNTYKTASARQMTVRTYGSRVAVVLGITKESGTTPSGRPFDHTYRFTDTWMERDGKWQCIAAHAAVAGRR
jgi:ketosteroid isomerase-like protein